MIRLPANLLPPVFHRIQQRQMHGKAGFGVVVLTCPGFLL